MTDPARAGIRALLQRGLTALRAGDREQALRWFDEVLACHPEQPDALHLRAEMLAAAGDLAGAEASVRRALAASPQHAHAWLRLGHVLSAQARYAEAADAFSRAAAGLPSVGGALQRRQGCTRRKRLAVPH